MGRKNASLIKRRNERVRARRRKQEYGRLFNGNVYAQGEFVFIWALVLAIILGEAAYFWLDNRPIDREDCEAVPLMTEEAHIIQDEDNGTQRLELTVKETDKLYTILWYTDSLADFREDAPGETADALVYKGEIVGLSLNGRDYLTLEDVNTRRTEVAKLAYILLIFAGAWLVYVAVSWYIMYNAEKFPRLIKFFVKPEYINRSKVYGKQRR